MASSNLRAVREFLTLTLRERQTFETLDTHGRTADGKTANDVWSTSYPSRGLSEFDKSLRSANAAAMTSPAAETLLRRIEALADSHRKYVFAVFDARQIPIIEKPDSKKLPRYGMALAASASWRKFCRPKRKPLGFVFMEHVDGELIQQQCRAWMALHELCGSANTEDAADPQGEPATEQQAGVMDLQPVQAAKTVEPGCATPQKTDSPPDDGWHFRPGEVWFNRIRHDWPSKDLSTILHALVFSGSQVSIESLSKAVDPTGEDSTLYDSTKAQVSKLRKWLCNEFSLPDGSDPIPSAGHGTRCYKFNHSLFSVSTENLPAGN